MNWVLVGLLALLCGLGVTGVLVFRSETAKSAQVQQELDAERAAHSADVQRLEDSVDAQKKEADDAKQRADALDKSLKESNQHAQELQATVAQQQSQLTARGKTDPVVAAWGDGALPQYVIDWVRQPVDAPSGTTGGGDQDGVRLPTVGIPAADAGSPDSIVPADQQLLTGQSDQGVPGSAGQVQCRQSRYLEVPGGLSKQVTLADGGTSSGVAGEASACWGGLAGSPDRPSTFILTTPLPEIGHNG